MSLTWQECLEEYVNDLFFTWSVDPVEGWGDIEVLARMNKQSAQEDERQNMVVLESELAQLEASDPSVHQAREQLDATIANINREDANG